MSKENLSHGNGANNGPSGDRSLQRKALIHEAQRSVAVLDEPGHSHEILKTWLEESSKLRLKCWRGVTIDAARQIAASPIDIVLIEAYWSGERAIRCAYLLKRLQPELTVINFADVPTLATCIRCYQAGADAYVTTPQTRQQLEETIQDAILRMHPFPREISKIIAEHWKRRFVLPDRSVLTESEAEVMAAVIQGKFDKEIASDRSTTHGTVHSILHGIYAKIGVHTRAEAVEHFLPLGEAFTIARQLASPNRSI